MPALPVRAPCVTRKSPASSSLHSRHLWLTSGVMPEIISLRYRVGLVLIFSVLGAAFAGCGSRSPNITITAGSVKEIEDARLGPVVAADVSVTASEVMKAPPRLIRAEIRDESGKVYRFFDYPNASGGTFRTSFFVSGPADPPPDKTLQTVVETILDGPPPPIPTYRPTNSTTFTFRFPLQQIPVSAGKVFVDATFQVGSEPPKTLLIKVR